MARRFCGICAGKNRHPHRIHVGLCGGGIPKNLGPDEDFVFLPKPFTLKKLAETVKAAVA